MKILVSIVAALAITTSLNAAVDICKATQNSFPFYAAYLAATTNNKEMKTVIYDFESQLNQDSFSKFSSFVPFFKERMEVFNYVKDNKLLQSSKNYEMSIVKANVFKKTDGEISSSTIKLLGDRGIKVDGSLEQLTRQYEDFITYLDSKKSLMQFFIFNTRVTPMNKSYLERDLKNRKYNNSFSYIMIDIFFRNYFYSKTYDNQIFDIYQQENSDSFIKAFLNKDFETALKIINDDNTVKVWQEVFYLKNNGISDEKIMEYKAYKSVIFGFTRMLNEKPLDEKNPCISYRMQLDRSLTKEQANASCNLFGVGNAVFKANKNLNIDEEYKKFTEKCK